MSYVGNIYKVFGDALDKKDGFTVGQKIKEIVRLSGKNLYEITDQELYQAIQKYLNTNEQEDEQFSEEEFYGWVELVTEKETKFLGFGRYIG